MIVVHSHPLAEPGSGDAGGMTVYVRQVARALASQDVLVDIYTRVDCKCRPDSSELFPGVRVLQIAAGDVKLAKEDLPQYLPEFTDGVLQRIGGSAYDLVHSHYWLSGSVASSVADRLAVPFVHTFHTLGLAKNGVLREADAPEPEGRLAGEARVIAEADAIVASTPQERRWLLDLYQARADRIHLIPPGVDHRMFSPSDTEAAKASLGVTGKRVLLFVGRLQPLKAPDIPIRAFAHLIRAGRLSGEDSRLLVVGGPSGTSGADEPQRLRALAGRLGVAGAVEFVSVQPHQKLPEFYRAADLAIVPSFTETFGLVALEAQACGVPVVASAVGGLSSIVRDGETGFLVEPGSSEQFADRVWRILSDPALASKMRKAAVERSMEFSWDRSAAELLDLYASVSSPKPQSARNPASRRKFQEREEKSADSIDAPVSHQ